MKFNYRLHRQCGTCHGPLESCLTFDSSGTTVLSVAHHRVQVYDLVGGSVRTMAGVEGRSNIKCMALDNHEAFSSPDGVGTGKPSADRLLVLVDDDDHLTVVNYRRSVVLHRQSFAKPVSVVAFGPTDPVDGRPYVAISQGPHVQVWKGPGPKREFAPMERVRTYTGLHEAPRTIDWGPVDGSVLLASSTDRTARLWSLRPVENFVPITLAGHRTGLVGAFFGGRCHGGRHVYDDTIYTLSEDGSLFHWTFVLDDDDDDDDDNDDEEEEEEEEKGHNDVDAAHYYRRGTWSRTKVNYIRHMAEGHVEVEEQGQNDLTTEEEKDGPARKPAPRKSNATVTCASFSRAQSMLAVGHADGSAALFELPSGAVLHTLSIDNRPVRSVALSPRTAEWLALGVPRSDSLLVWEWRSEQYVLKQRGHNAGSGANGSNAMRCMALERDGNCVATGGEDGSVKLWSLSSGYCYATLPDRHTAPVSALAISSVGRVLLSAGLDGTVAAHDLRRYRKFRTLTVPSSTPVQFGCVAATGGDDRDGILVAAGAVAGAGGAGEHGSAAAGSVPSVYVWDLTTGSLLEALAGHTGPVVSISFGPSGGGGVLATASWDGTARLWDLYTPSSSTTSSGKSNTNAHVGMLQRGAATADNGRSESLEHGKEVVCLAWRPDGKRLCTGTIGGLLQFWDAEQSALVSEIHGQEDIRGGRKRNDRVASFRNASSCYFTSVCYSADGSCVLAGGNSKYICIYEISQRILLKRFQITHNRSFDGVLDKLHSRNLVEGIPVDEVLDHGDDDVDAPFHFHLPGARRSDDGSRNHMTEARTLQVSFSATGREFAAVTSEGLLLYAIDDGDDGVFDPMDGLDETVTPATVLRLLTERRYGQALRLSLHLNEASLVHRVLRTTPYRSIPASVRVSLTGPRPLTRLLHVLAQAVTTSDHVEFYVEWTLQLFRHHAVHLDRYRSRYARAFRSLFRAVSSRYRDLTTMADSNQYRLQYLEDQAQLLATFTPTAATTTTTTTAATTTT